MNPEIVTIREDEFRQLTRDAEAWRALLADCDAIPCQCPDLRDSLHDWMSARNADRVSGGQEQSK